MNLVKGTEKLLECKGAHSVSLSSLSAPKSDAEHEKTRRDLIFSLFRPFTELF